MQRGSVVLKETILNEVLEARNVYYLITKIEEIATVGGMRYFDILVKEYDTGKKEVCSGTEEIGLTLPENLIEKAGDISVVEVGMLGLNNTGTLKVFNKPA